MAVTAEQYSPVEAGRMLDGDLTEEDRAALWLYQRLVGARHRPLAPSPRPRFATVYDESGYPVRGRPG
jgi:hypothetical protein